jgi:hypothetical protein
MTLPAEEMAKYVIRGASKIWVQLKKIDFLRN